MLGLDCADSAFNYLMTMAAAPIRDCRIPLYFRGMGTARKQVIECPSMDLIRLLKSVEELIYELVSWLVFYPLTLWRSVMHPQAMVRYGESELLDKEQDQFTDTMSPPIFLTVTLLLTALINTALVKSAPAKLPSFIADTTNLLIFRAIMFSILPLLMATKVLRVRHVPLDRVPLKPPFYSQCFISAPFALGVEISLTLSQLHKHPFGIISAVLFLLSVGWYWVVEARWFSDELEISRLRALGAAFVTILEGLALILVLLIIVALGIRSA